VAETIAQGAAVRRRGLLLIVAAIVVLILAGVALLFTALRAPEVGSEEDLGAQIDGLQLPASLVELDEHYVADCPTGPCPSLVRWFDATAPVDVIRAEIISHMNAAGVEINESSASYGVFAVRDETYIYFVVLDAKMIAGNRYAPPGTKAEISVHVLDQSLAVSAATLVALNSGVCLARGRFDPTRIAGNYVIIRTEKVYALYAHLASGSVVVGTGKVVHVGEVIARLGHSGNSTAGRGRSTPRERHPVRLRGISRTR
jgi:hypothetical protein